MKKRQLSLLASSALLVCSLPSYAQNSPRSVSTSGDPVADAISYSEVAANKKPPLDSVITILVTIANDNGNTLNNVRYEPEFFWTYGGSANLVAEFIEDPGSPCKVDAAGKQGVVCSVGQLQAQSPTTTFPIFFKSPLNPGGGVPGTFFLAGKTWFAEGTRDNQTNSSSDMLPVTVTLGTNSPVIVQSGVRKGGGSVYTGTGGVPTDLDKNASLLSVPALPNGVSFGFSKLDETKPPNCPALNPCLAAFDVTVSDKELGTKLRFAPAEQTPPVPVTDPLTQYLVVTLRRDDTLFTGNIAKVLIWYTASDGDTPQRVDQCSQLTDPLVPPIDRCILDRRVLKASDPEVKADPSLKGVAQIKIIEKENGRLFW